MTLSHMIVMFIVLLLNVAIIFFLWALFTGRLGAWFRRVFHPRP
ncbi:MAG TPA: hypothetical protein VN259_10440 [Xanthomonadales bacterium]|nr:hypothetical protein [Xanthomonadales bacterium]